MCCPSLQVVPDLHRAPSTYHARVRILCQPKAMYDSSRSSTARWLILAVTVMLSAYVVDATKSTTTPKPICNGTMDQVCYRYFEGVLTWQQAEQSCVVWGGHLSSIKSSAENSLARSFSNADCWIGFSDLAAEGSWTWTDGSMSNYLNWGKMQPDNCCGGENCGFLSGTGATTTHGLVFGTWADVDCSQRHIYGNGLGAAFVKGYLCSKPITGK